jgi:hypothetical protein
MRAPRIVCTEDLLVFEYSMTAHNYVKNPPGYAESIFKDDYSPFKKFLETVPPNKLLRLRVMLEVTE